MYTTRANMLTTIVTIYMQSHYMHGNCNCANPANSIRLNKRYIIP